MNRMSFLLQRIPINQNNNKRWFNEGKQCGIMAGVVLPAFVFDVTQTEMLKDEVLNQNDIHITQSDTNLPTIFSL